MSIVFALDSFKSSISARRAVSVVAEGWREIAPDTAAIFRPMADGGEGTLAAFLAADAGAVERVVDVIGADGLSHQASWVELQGRTGVVELANTSGIEMLAGALRPWDADTYGTGQAVAAALDHGMTKLIIGIGSSASTDAGTGLLRALGARFLDVHGSPVRPGARGLRDIAKVDVARLRPLPRGGLTVLSDVTNPLTGEEGAAYVFGPQKGLPAHKCPEVDSALNSFASVLTGVLPMADADAPGAGAAGGTGFALGAWGGQIRPGAAMVADLSDLPSAISKATFVVTGEGSFDSQSGRGKVVSYVQRVAADLRVPVGLIAGRVSDDADTSQFAEIVSLVDIAGSGDAAMSDPARWLRQAGHLMASRLT